jgi:SAM-dependent methyltransferase
MSLIDWLRLPETRNVQNLDDPETTLLHARIVQSKPFLRKLYLDFYHQLKDYIPETQSKLIVELGSGGGFIKEVIPNAVTSDVLELPNIDKVLSALDMPFEDNSVDAFVMFDVLHHIADPRLFFAEAVRCMKISGRIVMIEPANTLWSRFIYKNFHHENFDPDSDWTMDQTGPLSQANGAAPWIIFVRDKTIFERDFPSLSILQVRNHTPLRYLLSGGLSLRQLVPSFTYNIVKAVEFALTPMNTLLGMFQTIVLEKTDSHPTDEK